MAKGEATTTADKTFASFLVGGIRISIGLEWVGVGRSLAFSFVAAGGQSGGSGLISGKDLLLAALPMRMGSYK